MLVLLILFASYLVLQAMKDAKLSPHNLVDHTINWNERAIVGIAINVAYYGFSWGLLTGCLFYVPFTWIIFDLSVNLFLKENPITYQGSGHWDMLFKYNFDKPVLSMWLAKGVLLLITFVAHLIATGFF